MNRLQDEARVHKVTKRIHMLEEVNINVKLLTEMLSQYNKESSTDSDREIIKVRVSRLMQNKKRYKYNNNNPFLKMPSRAVIHWGILTCGRSCITGTGNS